MNRIPHVPGVRIIADDLTGALDAAAPLAARLGPFPVGWGAARVPRCNHAVFDTETRDVEQHTAIFRTAEAATLWWRGFGGLAFKKVDSMWRGHGAAEIAAAMTAGEFDCAVVAPAFPEQGRVTRDGAQWVIGAEGARCIAPDLVANLCSAGLHAAHERAAGSACVRVCDATDQDALVAVVARHTRPGTRTLWCGSAGLAHALAATMTAGDLAPARHGGAAAGPVLVIVGSDHPVTQEQARALARAPGVLEWWLDLERPESTSPVPAADIIALRFSAGDGTERALVTMKIQQALIHSVAALPRPRLVIVIGGATLFALSVALGANALSVEGERRVGVPDASWIDGRWSGIPVVTKSGGFGGPDLLVALVLAAATTAAAVPLVMGRN